MAFGIRWQELVIGGSVIAVADAILFSVYWRDPEGILQYIAAGLIGRDAAFGGGHATALLGAGLHVLIAITFLFAFAVLGLLFAPVRRYPYIAGPLFGVLAYLVMNDLVIPLSRLGAGAKPPVSWEISDILFHVIVVGFVCAYFGRRALSH